VFSYTAQLDSNPVLTIYGLASSSQGGGTNFEINNTRIGINTVTPSGTLSIVDSNIGSAASGSFELTSANTLGSIASLSGTSLTTGNLFKAIVPTTSTFLGQILNVIDTNSKTLASISAGGNAEFAGYASASGYALQDKDGGLMADCEGSGNKITWDLATFRFNCEQDQTGGGGGSANIEVRELSGGSTGRVVGIASVSFEGNMFNVVASAGSAVDAVVRLDWTNGPASRGMTTDQTWSGLNIFSANASVTGSFEITRNGTTASHLKLTDSSVTPEVKNYFSLSVNDGDFQVRHASSQMKFSDELVAFSISSKSLASTIGTPASPSIIGRLSGLGNIAEVYVSGKYAYVINDSTAAQAFQIIDISNPASPSLKTTVALSDTANDLKVVGRYAYIAVDNLGGLQIFDVSNAASPVLVGKILTTDATAVYVSGKYAYVADNTIVIRIIDVSNPASPTLVATYDPAAGTAQDVYVLGSYAYVAAGSAGLLIIDITNPSNPRLVGTIDPGNISSIYISGRYAYITDTGLDFHIIDVFNPSSPVLISTVSTPGSTSDIYVSGRYAYLADFGSGVTIIDISNANSPSVISTTPTTGSTEGVHVSGRYLYSASNTALDVIDIGGLETHALYAGNIMTNDITVSENVDIGNSLFVRNGLNVGQGGILANGPLSLTASYSFNTASVSRNSLLEVTQDKGRYAGDMFRLEGAASTSQEFFTGNFLRFMRGGTTNAETAVLIEANGSILASGAVQFGAMTAPSSTAYSRFGTGTTTVSNFDSANDLLISGSLLVQSQASITAPFEVTGYASASRMNIGAGKTFFTANNALNIFNRVTGSTTDAQTAGIYASYSFANATTDGFTFGNRYIVNVNNSSAASGSVGTLIRMIDSSNNISNTVRGLEVQAWSGANTRGINEAIVGFGKTFGVHGYTDALAGAKVNPAAVFAELGNQAASNSGNALRAYTVYGLKSDIVSIFQASSSYTGDALMISMASGSGTFSKASSGNFAKFNNGSATAFRIDADGNTFVNVSNRTVSSNQSLCANVASASRIGDCSGTGADLAENFGTQDTSIEAGDVVSYASEAYTTMADGRETSKAWIEKSSKSYQGDLLGVISTAPNQLFADDDVFSPEENPRPVTLVGRVPVKVNLQNGPIKTGDRLTSSNVPGIAMKATQPGQTIGIALESMSSVSFAQVATGSPQYVKIVVAINPGYWVPTSTDFAGNETSSSSVEFVYGGMPMTSLVNSVVTKLADMFQIVFEDGLIRVANIITDRFTTKELCIEDVCVSRDQLKALLDVTGVPQQATPTPTPSVSATPTPTPSESPLVTESPTPSPTASVSPEPTPTSSPTLEPTPTESVSPTPTPTPEPTESPTPTPSPSATPEPTPESTPEPTPTP
jgi:hypothetical protein